MKTEPLGICDFCKQPIPARIGWYTSKHKPRRFCSITCKNTYISRRFAAPANVARFEKLKQDPNWKSVGELYPKTPEEQSRVSKLGRLREVKEGRWRNPSLTPEAREKLSRPRTITDIHLHEALSQVYHQGKRIADLTPEQAAAYSAYCKRAETRRKEKQNRP